MMAFKELEHEDHWLGLQTIGLYPVLFLLLPLAPTCAVSVLEQRSFCSVIVLGCWSLNIVCRRYNDTDDKMMRICACANAASMRVVL